MLHSHTHFTADISLSNLSNRYLWPQVRDKEESSTLQQHKDRKPVSQIHWCQKFPFSLQQLTKLNCCFLSNPRSLSEVWVNNDDKKISFDQSILWFFVLYQPPGNKVRKRLLKDWSQLSIQNKEYFNSYFQYKFGFVIFCTHRLQCVALQPFYNSQASFTTSF